MNFKGLTTLYDRLTPSVRVSAYLAAFDRGDEAEQTRLLTAAPSVPQAVLDCRPHLQCLCELAVDHFMDVLETAARFDDGLRTNDEEFAVLFGFLLSVKVAGWRIFCERLSVPPLVLWRNYPSFERLERTLSLAEEAGFRPEDFLDRLRRSRPDLPANIGLPPAFTPEGIADALERTFREGIERCSG